MFTRRIYDSSFNNQQHQAEDDHPHLQVHRLHSINGGGATTGHLILASKLVGMAFGGTGADTDRCLLVQSDRALRRSYRARNAKV